MHFGKSAKFAIMANFAYLSCSAKGVSAKLRPESKTPLADKAPKAQNRQGAIGQVKARSKDTFG